LLAQQLRSAVANGVATEDFRKTPDFRTTKKTAKNPEKNITKFKLVILAPTYTNTNLSTGFIVTCHIMMWSISISLTLNIISTFRKLLCIKFLLLLRKALNVLNVFRVLKSFFLVFNVQKTKYKC